MVFHWQGGGHLLWILCGGSGNFYEEPSRKTFKKRPFVDSGVVNEPLNADRQVRPAQKRISAEESSVKIDRRCSDSVSCKEKPLIMVRRRTLLPSNTKDSVVQNEKGL